MPLFTDDKNSHKNKSELRKKSNTPRKKSNTPRIHQFDKKEHAEDNYWDDPEYYGEHFDHEDND